MLRVTSHDKALVAGMAKRAGVSLTDFVMAKVWGEEVGGAKGEDTEKVAAAPTSGQESVQDLARRLGMKTAAEVGNGAAAPSGQVADIRIFDSARPGWYEVLRRCDMGEILRDKFDRRLWVHQAGGTSARLCWDMAEAERVYERLQ